MILGSQEFAGEWLYGSLRETAPPHILLSDDCFTPTLFSDPDIAARCSIAFLEKRSGANDIIVDQNMCSLRNRAATLLGRAPGPYFETSYIATRALTAAWKNAGAENPPAVLRHLLNGQWRSPFGLLKFTGEGRLRGHHWRMIPARTIASDFPSKSFERRADPREAARKSEVDDCEQPRHGAHTSYESLPD